MDNFSVTGVGQSGLRYLCNPKGSLAGCKEAISEDPK